MRVALYARVSTSDKGQDPEMQLRELREYCERRGWIIAAEYVDVGVSGAKDSDADLKSKKRAGKRSEGSRKTGSRPLSPILADENRERECRREAWNQS